MIALHPAVPGVDSQDAVVISLNATTDVLLVLGPIGQVISAYNIPATGVIVAYEASPLQGLPAGLRSLQGLDYALTSAVTSVLGDPAFVGFHGQTFQVHGIPMRGFNLLTSANLQLNALFSAFEEGDVMTHAQMSAARVSARKAGRSLPNTVAFAHAGTYLTEIAICLSQARVHAVAGSYLSGMTSVSLDGRPVEVSSSVITISERVQISRPDAHTLVVDSPCVSFSITNADLFFNIEQASLTATAACSQPLELGGLLGQTADPAWTVEQHSTEFREHQLLDFLLASSDLFSSDFAANLFHNVREQRVETQ